MDRNQVTAEEIEALRKSKAFDPIWYCGAYPDVVLSTLDPAEHYLRIGKKLGRSPIEPSTASVRFASTEMEDLHRAKLAMERLAQEHAFSVQQLISQRKRLFEMLKAAGSVARFRDGTELEPTLRAVETTESQFYQDIYCLLVNQGKRDGFFVEFGACDGVLLSNTLLLEREFGWKGILSEPMPSWHEALERNRNCIIDKRCVWTETGGTIEFAEYEGDEYHTESSPYDAGAQRPVKSLIKVPTITLADLLRENDAPRTIDFLSMDVEGGEHAILSTFPFGEYRFNFMCVEQHGEHAERINNLLSQKGYRQVFAETSGHDGYYVPVDIDCSKNSRKRKSRES